jgi:hypothetical protein
MTLAGVDRQRREFYSKCNLRKREVVIRHRKFAGTLMGFQSASQFLALLRSKLLTTILQHWCFIDAPRVYGYLLAPQSLCCNRKESPFAIP